MLYQLFRLIVRISLILYFRKIHIDGVDRITRGKPVIFAVNHPNSFLEAVLLACFQPRVLHFLVRGDVFRSPYLRWFFRATNQIPIFRFRDGFSNLRNNLESFEYCYRALADNSAIIIFSEGSTKMVKQLRPLQRGTARLAFGTIQQHPDLDLFIVPVGVNFTDPDTFRSEAMVRFGKPIHVRDYVEDYKNEALPSIMRITKDIAAELGLHVIHFDHSEDELLGSDYLTLRRNQFFHPLNTIIRSDAQLRAEISAAKAYSKLATSEKHQWGYQLEQYRKEVYDIEYGDKVVWTGRRWIGIDFLVLIIHGIIALPGFLVSFIPFVLATYLRKKVVKSVEFHAAIRVALWAIFQFIEFLILIVFFWPIFGYWALFIFLSPLLAFPTTFFIDRLYSFWIKSHMVHKFGRLAKMKQDRQYLMRMVQGPAS